MYIIGEGGYSGTWSSVGLFTSQNVQSGIEIDGGID